MPVCARVFVCVRPSWLCVMHVQTHRAMRGLAKKLISAQKRPRALQAKKIPKKGLRPATFVSVKDKIKNKRAQRKLQAIQAAVMDTCKSIACWDLDFLRLI